MLQSRIYCLKDGALTRNYVASVHSIFIFDEAEAIHKLDLSDFAMAVGRKVCLDISLSCWKNN
jgi:hypothetical protein